MDKLNNLNLDPKQLETEDYKKLLTLIAAAVLGAEAFKFFLGGMIFSSLWNLDIFSGFDSNARYVLLWVLNGLISYAPYIVILHRVLGHILPRAFADGREPPTEPQQWREHMLPAFFIAAYSLITLSALLSHVAADFITSIFGNGEGLRDVFEHVMPRAHSQWYIIFIFVGIISPIFEEIIFRHMLLFPLRKYGDKQAVIITAVLFGAFHGNLTQFLYATVGGLVFGVVTVRTNSLKPAIILHMANNILGVVLAYVQSEYSGAEVIVVNIMYLLMLAGLVATVVLFRAKRFDVSDESLLSEQISAKERAKIALLHPAVLVLGVILAVTITLGSL
jgi:membrane protease YdiL (CAAX protease family)